MCTTNRRRLLLIGRACDLIVVAVDKTIDRCAVQSINLTDDTGGNGNNRQSTRKMSPEETRKKLIDVKRIKTLQSQSWEEEKL
jgi:hypothetical protein